MIMRLYEMKKKDFKKGQQVFLKAIRGNAKYLLESEIKKAYVTKVTNDYVYAKIDCVHESHKFSIERCFRQENGNDWKLFLSESQIEEEELAEKCITQIKDVFKERYLKSDVRLSLQKLKRICEVLDEVE